MADIRWTNTAVDWLKSIADYIARDNPAAAARTLEGILAKVELLQSQPYMGYQHISQSGRRVRVVLYGHYRIVYHVTQSAAVEIIGVFHAAMKIEDYLR